MSKVKNAAALRRSLFLVGAIALVTLSFAIFHEVVKLQQGVDQPLYYSSRLEETGRMAREAGELFDYAEQYARGSDQYSYDDVILALDIFWSRVNSINTRSYTEAFGDKDIDSVLIPELAKALPSFDDAVRSLKSGEITSYEPLYDLKVRFSERLGKLAEFAWSRRTQMQTQLAVTNLNILSRIQHIQVGFVAIIVLFLSYVVSQLLITRRLNTKLHNLVEEKSTLLLTDPLTQIANRDGFEKYVNQLSAFEKPDFSIVLMDLDGFKEVNDALGHSVGDRLLKDVAYILSSQSAGEGLACRFGGDEFALVVPGALNAAEACAEHIRAQVEALTLGQEYPIRFSISAGICHWSSLSGDCTIDEILSCADFSLYSAKEMGKNRIVIFQASMQEQYASRKLIHSLLPVAIAEQKIDVHFQPIVDLTKGRAIFALEALIRWNISEGHPIETKKLIEVAETNGQIKALTCLVLRRALRLSKRLHDNNLTLNIAVNFSALLLSDPNLASEMTAILEEERVEETNIVLELSKYEEMEGNSVSNRNLIALSRMGFNFSIDDFGCTSSNIRTLLAVEDIRFKLAEEIVRDVVVSNTSRELLRGLVSFISAFDAMIVAGGVDQEEQAQIVQEVGIRYAQGDCFYSALTEDAAFDLVTNQ
ncbi:EAL domain-containing protein [Marinomonas gallaica]|uniref:EAL domain-containing protein n=1 Tax=Marinomonas gallaica TaxID=1806667 RepID=UPI003CE52880